ncbi:DNA polymerase-3 subunit epsilon [Clostridium cavendishii DSM 21758]|uniref:DNA polymerase-3 subunit epsilon n=1 Tax=Clostridium cavendishii DSM 21758 TaxID=1121302 RepID=A0A1M6IA75_9CLOT|nr:exonuclease domain-containing protein [Clostridium cavendishii]SHJ31306.1 DNA polymerase-3 subunit epsilon [Clostridium cavendishii DSM 21758]
MDFIAIDFETANEMRHSPCSLGITVVKDNKIIEEKYWLIKPKELRFTPMNIMIHGIRQADVENEKEFDKLWPEIKQYFNNTLVIAHNASFDISVLRKTLNLYNIPYPNFSYLCTMVISRNFFPNLENAKLDTISTYLGYKFEHHHASADATACANILIKIIDELKPSDLNNLSELLNIKVGYINKDGYKACGKLNKTSKTKKNIDDSTLYSKGPISFLREVSALKTNYFKNKVVVFTGALPRMSRGEAMSIIRRLGATTGGSVTKKTDILVIGGKNLTNLLPHEMSTKRRRAMDLISKGHPIEIITADDFFKIIYSTK